MDNELKRIKGLIASPQILNRTRRGIGQENQQYRRGGIVFHPYHKSASAPKKTANGFFYFLMDYLKFPNDSNKTFQ